MSEYPYPWLVDGSLADDELTALRFEMAEAILAWNTTDPLECANVPELIDVLFKIRTIT